MRTFLSSAFIYYLSWLPFYFVKDKLVTISINNIVLAETEIKYLVIWYFPFTLLALIPILLMFLFNRNKRIRKLESKLENAKQLQFETEVKLNRKERIKFGSLSGYVEK
jgi:hypothetical protein